MLCFLATIYWPRLGSQEKISYFNFHVLSHLLFFPSVGPWLCWYSGQSPLLIKRCGFLSWHSLRSHYQASCIPRKMEMDFILFTDKKQKSGIFYYPKGVVYTNLSTASKELQSSRALLNNENPSWIELLKELQLTLRTAWNVLRRTADNGLYYLAE